MAAPTYSPLPYTSPDELWQIALSELRNQMTKATFNTWLADSTVLTAASNFNTLVIAVRNRHAEEWLTYRLSPVIARTLAGIAGQRINFRFVSKNYAKDATASLLEEPWYGDASSGPELMLAQHSYHPQNASWSQGEETMTPQSNRTRVRIHSHVIQSRFLHIEDALAIGKLRLFAGNYRKGQGMNAYAIHFLDLADARVIFYALARGEQGFTYKEYKGTPPPNRLVQSDGRAAVSRVLSVVIKGETVYIELKTGPGKLSSTGAIMPNGPAKVEVNVGFKLYGARRMAASVLAYIQAWDVMRMMCHNGVVDNRQMVSQPMPYTSTTLSTSLLVTAVSEAHSVQTGPANGASKPDSTARSPVVTANGRPVTRKDSVPKANGAAVKPLSRVKAAPAKLDTAMTAIQLLQYGDGSMVDMENLTEVQTFQRYKAEMKALPESKPVLLDYYRKGVQTSPNAACQ